MPKLWLLIILGFCHCGSGFGQKPPPNVLFIMVDDLRPQLGCYGDPTVKTPNIDRLASNGTVFLRAYCQQALCSPSRTSLLTGHYPERLGVTDIETHFRQKNPQMVTLPQYFKQNGYHVAGLNKIFHLVGFEPQLFGNLNDSLSWSVPHWLPKRSGWGPEGEKVYQTSRAEALRKGSLGYGNIPRSLALESPDLADSLLSDGETAQEAIKALRKLANSPQPFFLAVGFYKPHLPFVAPQKYWDLYEEEKLQLPKNQFPPSGSFPYTIQNTNELRSYADIPKQGAFDERLKKKLLHGYLACVSYVDAQIGLLTQELERLGMRQNTIVVLLGDHGFQVGEHDMWGSKHTNFEISTHAPLVFSVPGQAANIQKTKALVEFVDIYPTLVDLCNLPQKEGLAGRSFAGLFQKRRASFREVAYSFYPRGGRMGRSVRSDHYRYTEWTASDGTVDIELYDHQHDPQENENVARKPQYRKVIAKLKKQIPQVGNAN
jgi:arylsulfatase A-like enzyme